MSDYGVPEQRPAPGAWDPFAPEVAAGVNAELRVKLEQDAQARRQLLVAIFGPPHARAWLEQTVQREAEAFAAWRPGQERELLTWSSGRLAVLRELLEQVNDATRPRAARDGD